MERERINVFLATNASKFEPTTLLYIKKNLETMSDDKLLLVFSVNYIDPVLIVIIAFLFGLDRFFIGDIGLGILKVITCGGLGIWWLIDIFTASKRTKVYNYKKFTETSSLM